MLIQSCISVLETFVQLVVSVIVYIAGSVIKFIFRLIAAGVNHSELEDNGVLLFIGLLILILGIFYLLKYGFILFVIASVASYLFSVSGTILFVLLVVLTFRFVYKKGLQQKFTLVKTKLITGINKKTQQKT